ncbi:LytR family transcriptional regulator [Nocardia panacis]|uniref:LytR family transcriptional regulator n=1 Tax=Nocardia panacis TaxID=2340916 RepID=A0A3A4KF51_9NOCA|nr:envelope integrity protein Cei [Nocardia panacis]RJO72918.1 LytR family transcriptional regulator [Nocardia panacis]
MVSLITEGTATDRQGRPYLRRRPETWLIFVLVLALISAIIWITAFSKADKSGAAMACNSPTPPTDTKSPPPAPPTQLGQRVGASRLQDVEPAPLAQSKVRVLNANNKSGQAAHIAAALGDLGFTGAPGAAYGNDSVYVNGDLICTGQIRFGVNGRPAAASVQLVAPCAELIEDPRQDDSVDLVLGSVFGESLRPSADAEEVLRSLKNPAPGGSPAIDAKLLAAARHGRC